VPPAPAGRRRVLPSSLFIVMHSALGSRGLLPAMLSRAGPLLHGVDGEPGDMRGRAGDTPAGDGGQGRQVGAGST
jgi:hypothetical protein